MGWAIMTTFADCGENFFTLRNIATLGHGLPNADTVAMMRYCSLTKWVACGVTLMLLWWTFVPSRRGSALYRLLALAVAIFSVVAGSLGVLGLWDNPKFEMVIPFFGLSLVLQLPLFWWFWDDVVGQHATVCSVSPVIRQWGSHFIVECKLVNKSFNSTWVDKLNTVLDLHHCEVDKLNTVLDLHHCEVGGWLGAEP